jgi:hypothetical protein
MNELTIVWNRARSASWESTWIEYLFRNIPHKTIENLDRSQFIDNSIIVESICWAPHHNQYCQDLHDRGLKFGIIHLTDESTRDNIDSYRHAKFVLRNYYREGLPEKVLNIPLGYNDNFTDLTNNLNSRERKYLWSYVGERWDQNRNVMAGAMRTVPNGNLYVVHHTGPRMSVVDMSRMYRDSVFVPCPRGAISMDNFRVTEALEAGCIPIVERSDYWAKMHGPNPPLIQIGNWQEVPNIIADLANDPARLEMVRLTCKQWWEERKLQLTDQIEDLVASRMG